ncbi:hypothetical protein OD91_2279 [Lutibacter sp. Hel_I_33_5]|uniref:hypothetical protein n=1 Tax=Lutibacter sp. Hel_I_33_5 TaxID=1566289 RepID=UPI0011A035B2|nr:hypothetical protein [Lutibacter sp. Hel_I_33_5]TVZ56975.1 hypothetical protein OD91_2279 [Lutibacter sp. Hel_I_33_5]
MKKIIFLASLFFTMNCFSQSFLEAYENTRHFEPFDHANGLYDGEFETLTGNPEEWSKVMGILHQFDDIQLAKRGFDGSVFLFDEWENRSVVYANNTKFVFPNLNYNIEKDEFMFRLNDSTYVFDMNKVQGIKIKNKSFKSVNVEGVKNNFEIVHKTKKISLLKKYSISLSKASPNPMVNRKRSKIKRKSKYYLERANNLTPFSLRKSAIVKLVSIDKIKDLKWFVKSKKLSYKKEEDVKIILNYISNLNV